MPSSTLLLVRAFGPATALGMLSLLIYAVLAQSTTPLLGPALRPLTWVPLGGLLIAAGWYLASLVRLWRWEAGQGLECPFCGGPLGHERSGIRGRSDYRRCYACGRAAAERHYR